MYIVVARLGGGGGVGWGNTPPPPIMESFCLFSNKNENFSCVLLEKIFTSSLNNVYTPHPPTPAPQC